MEIYGYARSQGFVPALIPAHLAFTNLIYTCTKTSLSLMCLIKVQNHTQCEILTRYLLFLSRQSLQIPVYFPTKHRD
jgi:hypothetical protein